jgi:ElaB/YqjD/DUF883 family membrane-anchored ribosome-binding protein
MPARLLALVALLLSLSAVAAGCGGKSQSPEEKWANSICGSVTTWKDSVTSSVDKIRSELQSPSSASVDSIRSEISSISDATTKLSSDLKSTGAPNTPAGTEAKQKVESLATQLDHTVQQAKSSVPEGASITTVVTSLSSLAPTIETLGTSAQTTLKSIESSATAMKDGFQKADACKPYR